ncbi:hypothetical protein [Klebsiella pneumoniae]|uniref:hypothetical protein n=1 Tax=Klebsiella pneumoniae TaxID=573 RepID=UPI0013C33E39
MGGRKELIKEKKKGAITEGQAVYVTADDGNEKETEKKGEKGEEKVGRRRKRASLGI